MKTDIYLYNVEAIDNDHVCNAKRYFMNSFHYFCPIMEYALFNSLTTTTVCLEGHLRPLKELSPRG